MYLWLCRPSLTRSRESKSLSSVARFLVVPDASLETTRERLLARGVLAGTETRAVDVLCQGSGLAGDECGRAPSRRERTQFHTHSLSPRCSTDWSRLTHATYGRCRTEQPPRKTARRSETRTSLSLRSSALSNNQATRPLLRPRRRRRTTRLRPLLQLRRNPRLRTSTRRPRRNHHHRRLRRATRRLR